MIQDIQEVRHGHPPFLRHDELSIRDGVSVTIGRHCHCDVTSSYPFSVKWTSTVCMLHVQTSYLRNMLANVIFPSFFFKLRIYLNDQDIYILSLWAHFVKENYKCDIRCQNVAKSPRPPFHSVCLSVKNSKISKYPLLEITEGSFLYSVPTTVYHWIHSSFFYLL